MARLETFAFKYFWFLPADTNRYSSTAYGTFWQVREQTIGDYIPSFSSNFNAIARILSSSAFEWEVDVQSF